MDERDELERRRPVVKIRPHGNSVTMSIPKALLDALGWLVGDYVVLDMELPVSGPTRPRGKLHVWLADTRPPEG